MAWVAGLFGRSYCRQVTGLNKYARVNEGGFEGTLKLLRGSPWLETNEQGSLANAGQNAAMVIRPWSVQAVNLPEHADNPIHTDAGAAAAGFQRALVAGVTVYAVLTRPVADADPDWPRCGAGEVRFRSPVFDGDLIEMAPVHSDAGWTVEARVAGALRASLVVLTDFDRAAAFEGAGLQVLAPLSVVLDGTYADYGQRSGDDLALYDDGTVHPSVWLKLANRVFRRTAGEWSMGAHTKPIRSLRPCTGWRRRNGVGRSDPPVLKFGGGTGCGAFENRRC